MSLSTSSGAPLGRGDGDVEVIVVASLSPEESIYPPAAIQPDLDASLVQSFNNLDNVRPLHVQRSLRPTRGLPDLLKSEH